MTQKVVLAYYIKLKNNRYNSKANYQMGVYYEKGQYFPKNLSVAFEFYMKSADKCYHPGTILSFKLLNLLKKILALRQVGYCYENGLGVKQNFEMAMAYYNKAIEAGSVNGLFYIYSFNAIFNQKSI